MSFSECVTYAELQEMAQASLQPAPQNEIDHLEKSLKKATKERRVRFAEDHENSSENCKLLYRKEDYFFHLSVPLKHRQKITNWLEERGIETLWAPEAAAISPRPVVYIHCSDSKNFELPANSIIFPIPLETESLANFLEIDRRHFSLIWPWMLTYYQGQFMWNPGQGWKRKSPSASASSSFLFSCFLQNVQP